MGLVSFYCGCIRHIEYVGGDGMTRFYMFTDEELDAMESAFYNEDYNLRPSNYSCDMISIGTVLQIIDKYRNEVSK